MRNFSKHPAFPSRCRVVDHNNHNSLARWLVSTPRYMTAGSSSLHLRQRNFSEQPSQSPLQQQQQQPSRPLQHMASSSYYSRRNVSATGSGAATHSSRSGSGSSGSSFNRPIGGPSSASLSSSSSSSSTRTTSYKNTFLVILVATALYTAFLSQRGQFHPRIRIIHDYC